MLKLFTKNKFLNTQEVEPSKTSFQDFYLRFKKHKMAMPSVYIILLIILLSIVVPFFTGHKYDDIDWSLSIFPSAPDSVHLFGTDDNGRDLLTRLFIGTRITLLIALMGTVISVIVGLIYGSVAGYLGGKVESVMMRIIDIMYSVPDIMIFIMVSVIFQNTVALFIVVALFMWLSLARMVRGQTISLKNSEFIDAAKSYALPTYLIILRHIIPNLLGVVALQIVGKVPLFIFIEATLSFIGLGVKEPLTSLGILLFTGAKSIETYPWVFLFPFLIFALLLIAFNFIADATRDALDKKTR